MLLQNITYEVNDMNEYTLYDDNAELGSADSFHGEYDSYDEAIGAADFDRLINYTVYSSDNSWMFGPQCY